MPEPGQRRRALARPGAGETRNAQSRARLGTCFSQSRARGGPCHCQTRGKRGMPFPETGQRRHGRARPRTDETCPCPRRATGDRAATDPGQARHAFPRDGRGKARLCQSRARGGRCPCQTRGRETCLSQRQARGGTDAPDPRQTRDMPLPETDHRRHGRARVGTDETCPCPRRGMGDMPLPETAQTTPGPWENRAKAET